jgi:GNAT superfamily N-acetyltransferase
MTEPSQAMTMRSLPADRLAAAAAVYTRAFMDDPISVWIAPDPAQRERGLPLYFRMAMQYALRFGGQIHRSDDSPRAVATWLEPGRSPPSTIGMLRTGLLRLLWSGGLSDARRLLTLGDTFDRLHEQDMTQPHWYLWLLAVDPPFQGKGLGGDLLRPALDEADRERLPCYLETARERNVSFYLRFGFRMLRDEQMGRDGPRFWTLLRAPR